MDLNEAREQIDLIDDQMAKLFEKRMDLAKEIGTYKHDNNLPAVNQYQRAGNYQPHLK